MSSQKLRLISAAVRVNMQFLFCCWRLRNQHELDAVIEELSALLPKEQLYRLYEQATREPYSFLFVYYLKPKNEMFYKRFEERFALEKDRRMGGFLKKRMTTIYVDSRKRVAGSDSDFEVDLGESLHLQSERRLAVYKIRLADSFFSTERGRYLYWVDRAGRAELGVVARRRVHGRPAGRLDQLQLCHRHRQRDHEQPERSLRRQPARSERPGAAPAIF